MKGVFSLIVGVTLLASVAAHAEIQWQDRGAQPFYGGALNATFNFPSPEFVGAVRFRIPPNCPMSVSPHFISARTGLDVGGLGPVAGNEKGYTVVEYNVGSSGDGALLTRIEVTMSSAYQLANCGVRVFTSSVVDDNPDNNPNPL